MDIHSVNYLSLYTGGAGLDLGFRLANPTARPVCYVERELQAAALLVDHIEAGILESAPIWSDAETLDCEPFAGRVDWIIAGPPCQPFSKAGLKLGADDPRNQWPTTLRVVSRIAPRFCFFENVAAADLIWYVYEDVEPCLRALGYEVEIGIFSAKEVGATQLRERVFIMARAENADRRRAEGTDNTWRRTSKAGGSGGELASRNGEPVNPGKRPAGYEFERSGRKFPPGRTSYGEWATYLDNRPDLSPASKPGFRRGVDGLERPLDGLPRAARLRILGNGVVPQQAAFAFDILASRFVN